MRISSRNNKNSNIMNRATSSSSTVLGVGCLLLLLILAPSAPSSSKYGFVEAVEFIADNNAVDVADTEQIISIQYSTRRTMMEEDVDGGDSDFNSTTTSSFNSTTTSSFNSTTTSSFNSTTTSSFNSTTTSSNDVDGMDDSSETETETEPNEYNDHGIEGHNHDTDHSSPDLDETVELLSTTMEDSAAATTTATGGSAHSVVLVIALAVSIVITASSSSSVY
ncbi:hypothetical protein FRACYDRAFT_238369 [Fragilariopsis cylindrus CCMP1102]|uniref:Uncharacterized protein n=1 Tax=Fragilariopsis cylindrus CCMP1102 TaxID=635003 RepID=A0A1E7FIC8_9STRA|nr:hypothetical protein FRACYDRAFT_238369 [Fragilariopsis cylindrus CCMP1102]|eukprot:OEU17939.1 hypothetical protein FRACYDRAFT_238369 [Fragilariopsis cylindrus CCMP1102]